MLWWEWLGRLKWRATGLEVSLLFFFYVSYVFAEEVRQSSPCFTYEDFLAYRAGYAIDDICGDAWKMVSNLNGSIGS